MIYADNAATTRLSESVLQTMTETLKLCWGNPSSVYQLGAAAKKVIEQSRQRIGELFRSD
ncbi:MAG: aminotransferase class V-fold PLP-dependent enzyme, partial [Planctomycetaceae bacterium]|nr:aminotransferase class V-fold PLP-dependent enzyme [Planctomycetaceae bacterium]